VPLTVASATRDRGEARAAAPFLTHLLATAQGVPQTCARGRAEPTRAAAAYADCMRRPAAWPVAPHETLTAA
jgi:hypothetical protein